MIIRSIHGTLSVKSEIRSVITRHISNVFRERESNVQKIHIANSDKPVQIYAINEKRLAALQKTVDIQTKLID